ARKTAPIQKGAAQRIAPFNPNKDVSLDEHGHLYSWQRYGQDGPLEGEQPQTLREELPSMHPHARKRGLMRLAAKTQVRRDPETGEREYLLHRGVLEHEREYVAEDGKSYRYHDRSSWTPHLHVAQSFTKPEGHSFEDVGDEELRPGS